MEHLVLIGVIAVVIIVLLVIIATMYVKAPPSMAYILSGFRKEPRVLIGGGGVKIPVLERLDKVYLGQVTVDVKTSQPVPTHDFLDVMVDAVCKVRVKPDTEGTRLAAKNFLNMNSVQIAAQVKDSLEGNMREVVGSLDLIKINTDRDAFSDEIQKKAAPDMAKLGLEILSCNIQNITDEKGLIRDLGADNTAAIQKNAKITRANADRDVAKAQAEADNEANEARVKADTIIAERNNELAIKRAELKRLSDIKKAESDAAYEIQQQEQQKTINIKTVDADIEKTRKEQTLSEEKIKIKQNEYLADVNAKADADKYQTEIDAQAALEKQKREAEAEAYKAEQTAKAVKAKAEANRYSQEQEAAGIRAKGEAEAYATQQTLTAEAEGTKAKLLAEAEGTKAKLLAEAEGVKAKGLAEAEAMQKKAEAYSKYGSIAVIDMLSKLNEKVLPDMAKYIAEPMSKIGNMTVYGTNGSEASGISGNVPAIIKQTRDIVKDATGVDMADIMKANTIDAKVNKNVNVNGNVENTNVNV
jgi:flotillin